MSPGGRTWCGLLRRSYDDDTEWLIQDRRDSPVVGLVPVQCSGSGIYRLNKLDVVGALQSTQTHMEYSMYPSLWSTWSCQNGLVDGREERQGD